MWNSILILILFTFIFFYVINMNVETTRCNKKDEVCYDGNGKYQYKGRGEERESVEVLLSRIDWLAKNAANTSFYTISYIIAYAIVLAVGFILYGYAKYLISPWEMILVLFSSYIICFSILNLFNFHTDKYPNYYIRKNINYIAERFNIPISEPPNPVKKGVPHRTEIQDVLSK